MIDKEKQYKRQNDFIREKYSRINCALPKNIKDEISREALRQKKTAAEFIRDAIYHELERCMEAQEFAELMKNTKMIDNKRQKKRLLAEADQQH